MNILALDVGGTAIKSALFDQDSRMLRSMETPSEARMGGERLMRNVMGVIGEYEGFSAIGVSVTGQVDAEAGSILFANDNVPNFTGTKVAEIIRNYAGVPVAVENDVNAAALGEAYFGAGRNSPDFLCLTYGTGVGGAIVLDGQIYRGAKGVAAEMGHILTHPDGKLCTCGQRGCYEQYASAAALVASARRIRPDIQDGRALFEKAEGDLELKKVIRDWEAEVVCGLASLVHVFNPSLVVLGGGVMSREEVVADIQEMLLERIMPMFRDVKLSGARMGNHAGIWGAYMLAKRLVEEE
jgi:glucokinase